jgi:hypothetical protein
MAIPPIAPPDILALVPDVPPDEDEVAAADE